MKNGFDKRIRKEQVGFKPKTRSTTDQSFKLRNILKLVNYIHTSYTLKKLSIRYTGKACGT